MPSWTSHGPLRIQGGVALHQEETNNSTKQKLTVIDAAGNPSTAGINASTADAFGGRHLLLQLSPGSDCIVLARVEDVPEGSIALSAVQQHNLHVKAATVAEFRVFRPESGQPFELVDLEAEVTLMGKEEEGIQVDAAVLAQQFAQRYFGHVVAVNESCILDHEGYQLLLRVAATNTLTQEEQEDCVGYHCYRGLVTPDTQIYLSEVTGPAEPPIGAVAAAANECVSFGSVDDAQHDSADRPIQVDAHAEQDGASSSASESEDRTGAGGSASAPQSTMAGRMHVQLVNASKRSRALVAQSTVKVVTSDGEWFPVRRKLLRPCIALTKAVRSEETAEVPVDVDTLTFDRVLIFLEAEALGKPSPGFGVHVIPEMLEAAQKLGLRSLEDYCQKRLGDMELRLRWFSMEEIQRRNGQGECLLVLDGMVLDVTRWLPEHPGGATIILRQSLNIDCSRFFELYHHSRESFLYLQEFYIGEVLPEDREELPRKEPSADFLQQLRDYTGFRMQPIATHTHLGSKH